VAERRLPIHSFRVVFELERRIHKIDRWRIPVPYGVPLRGLAYWAVALIATIALARVPLVGTSIGALPAPIRLVVLPVGIAYFLARVELDGRPAHAALSAWVRLRASPSRTAAARRVPAAGSVIRLGEVTLLPDERTARYRAALIEGPAELLLRRPFSHSVRRRRRPTLHVRPLAGPPLFAGKQVRLRAGQRMVVRA
jgi:hypothetical protein